MDSETQELVDAIADLDSVTRMDTAAILAVVEAKSVELRQAGESQRRLWRVFAALAEMLRAHELRDRQLLASALALDATLVNLDDWDRAIAVAIARDREAGA